MSIQQYANGPVGALSASMLVGDTSLIVTSATGFPTVAKFTIKIDNELILVTAVSGTTFTITRAQEGTTATTHASAAGVYMPLTVASLQALVVQSHGGTVIATRRQLNLIDSASVTWTMTDDPTNNKIDLTAAATGGGGGGGQNYEATWTTPSLGSFTWVNQGSATTATDSSGIYLKAPAAAGNNARLLNVAAPSTPYTITARIVPAILGENYGACGLHWYDSGSTKLVVFVFTINKISIQKYSAPGAYASTYQDIIANGQAPFYWMRIADDGTNRICSVSVDGVTWAQVHSIGNTDYLTATHVGWHAEANNAFFDAGVKLVSWTT